MIESSSFLLFRSVLTFLPQPRPTNLTTPILGGRWANLPTPVISGRKCAMCAIFGINMQYNIKFQKKSKILEKSDDVIIFPGKTVKN